MFVYLLWSFLHARIQTTEMTSGRRANGWMDALVVLLRTLQDWLCLQKSATVTQQQTGLDNKVNTLNSPQQP